MRWIWSAAKNRQNIQKHHLSFDAARLVFEDRLAISVPDPLRMGIVGGQLV
ncbi:MAG: BrnT family toxin [Stellaceae bacterium]